MPQNIGDEVEVGGFVDFRYHESVEVFGFQDFVEIVKCQPTGDIVYADGDLIDVGRARFVQELEDVLAGRDFVGECYAVFKVVGDGVYSEGVGLLEEFGGGGWHCIESVSALREGVRGHTVEQSSPQDCGCFCGHCVNSIGKFKRSSSKSMSQFIAHIDMRAFADRRCTFIDPSHARPRPS